MSWSLVIQAYLVCWWIVLFMVLPIGTRAPEQPSAGHSSGAPKRAHLRRKLLATTVLTAAVTPLVVWLLDMWFAAARH